MALTMARPYKHPKTGIYWLRKVVPVPLREAVGQRELKASLRTKDPEAAKVEARVALDRFDAILATARAKVLGTFAVLRDGSGNLHRVDEWSFCLTAARMAAEQERR